MAASTSLETVDQAAERLGVNRGTVHKWRRGCRYLNGNSLWSKIEDRTCFVRTADVDKVLAAMGRGGSEARVSYSEAEQLFGLKRTNLKRYKALRGLVTVREWRSAGHYGRLVETFDRRDLEQIQQERQQGHSWPYVDSDGKWWPPELAAELAGTTAKTVRSRRTESDPALGRTIRYKVLSWKGCPGANRIYVFHEADLLKMGEANVRRRNARDVVYSDGEGAWLSRHQGLRKHGFAFNGALRKAVESQTPIPGRVRKRRIRNPSQRQFHRGLLWVYHEGDFVRLIGNGQPAEPRPAEASQLDAADRGAGQAASQGSRTRKGGRRPKWKHAVDWYFATKRGNPRVKVPQAAERYAELFPDRLHPSADQLKEAIKYQRRVRRGEAG